MGENLGDKARKAVKCPAMDNDNLLRFLKCPVEHHKIVRTTNVIEPRPRRGSESSEEG